MLVASKRTRRPWVSSFWVTLARPLVTNSRIGPSGGQTSAVGWLRPEWVESGNRDSNGECHIPTKLMPLELFAMRLTLVEAR
jgi:hypothetical protein